MATAPISRRLNLTRDQLAAFLTDQQQIRQFELLFSTVDTLQVIVGTDFEFQADNAAATANEALAQINALSQVVDLNGQAEALSYLAEISKQIQALESAPPFSAPPAVTPASPTTSVQFNNAGVFGGSANFTYNTGTNTVSFGNITGSALGMTIQPLAPTSVENAGQLTLRARNAVKANSSGGEILLATGTPTGTGDRGRVVVQAGTFSYQGASASTFDGGSFTATCGNGFRTGGGYLAVCGNGTGTVGTGGSAYFETGSATQAGGTAGDAYFYVGRNEITDQGGAFRFGSSTFGDAIYITHDAIDLQMGFFNTAPVYKPVVTGSRASGAALQNLLTQLANLGLITDSTTA